MHRRDSREVWCKAQSDSRMADKTLSQAGQLRWIADISVVSSLGFEWRSRMYGRKTIRRASRIMRLRQRLLRNDRQANSECQMLLHELPGGGPRVRTVCRRTQRGRCRRWNGGCRRSQGSCALRQGSGPASRISSRSSVTDTPGSGKMLQFAYVPRFFQGALADYV